MKTRLRNWFGIVLIIVLFLMILIFRDFFLTTVIQPLATLIWALIRLLDSVHQRFYWAILILVSFILVIRNLPPDRNLNTRYQDAASVPAMEGYDHWMTLIRQSQTQTGDRKLLRTRLTRLLIFAISTSEHREISLVQSEFLIVNWMCPPQFMISCWMAATRIINLSPDLKYSYMLCCQIG